MLSTSCLCLDSLLKEPELQFQKTVGMYLILLAVEIDIYCRLRLNFYICFQEYDSQDFKEEAVSQRSCQG